MGYHKETLEQAKRQKRETVYYTIEAEGFRAIWDVSILSAFFILVTWTGSSAFNLRTLHFLLTIGDFIPPDIAIWIGAPLALAIGWALVQQSFKKALGQIRTQGNFTPTFKGMFLSWLFNRSFAIVMIMIFGVCGALLFLWGETDKDEFEVQNASTTAGEIQRQIEILDYNYQQDRDRVQKQIDFYMQLNLVRKEVRPREVKLAKMQIDYQQRRDDLNAQLETARGEAGKFRPTAFLSAIIAGSLWKRIVVITLLAILLQATIDLASYSITTIAVSRAYAAGMIYDGQDGELNIFNIYNNLIGTEKATPATKNATLNATSNNTQTQQTETPENKEKEKLIRGNATYMSDLQGRMLQLMQEQIDKGINLGEINKSKLADVCEVERSTIYRNWDEVIKHISLPTNGKYQEEHV